MFLYRVALLCCQNNAITLLRKRRFFLDFVFNLKLMKNIRMLFLSEVNGFSRKMIVEILVILVYQNLILNIIKYFMKHCKACT